MFRRFLVAAVVVLALVSSATAVLPAAAKTNKAVVAHKLIVTVKKNLSPAAEKKLAFLVLITQNGGAPAAAVVKPSKALTVLLDNSGLYRVKAEIDSSCKGSCVASYRVSGSADRTLEIVPSCRPKGSGFVCNRVKIVAVPASSSVRPATAYRTLTTPATWRTPPRPFRYLSVGTFGRLTRFGLGTVLVNYAYSPASTNAAVVVEVIKSASLAQSWFTSIKVKNGATAVPSTRAYRWVTNVGSGYEPNMTTRVGFVVVTATGEETKQRPTRTAWAHIGKLLAFAAGRARSAQR